MQRFEAAVHAALCLNQITVLSSIFSCNQTTSAETGSTQATHCKHLVMMYSMFIRFSPIRSPSLNRIKTSLRWSNKKFNSTVIIHVMYAALWIASVSITVSKSSMMTIMCRLRKKQCRATVSRSVAISWVNVPHLITQESPSTTTSHRCYCWPSLWWLIMPRRQRRWIITLFTCSGGTGQIGDRDERG